MAGPSASAAAADTGDVAGIADGIAVGVVDGVVDVVDDVVDDTDIVVDVDIVDFVGGVLTAAVPTPAGWCCCWCYWCC